MSLEQLIDERKGGIISRVSELFGYENLTFIAYIKKDLDILDLNFKLYHTNSIFHFKRFFKKSDKQGFLNEKSLIQLNFYDYYQILDDIYITLEQTNNLKKTESEIFAEIEKKISGYIKLYESLLKDITV